MVAVKKAGRGAGKRGGRGLAGINKHRVMTRIKYMPNHWGMHGFNRHPSLRTVNVTVNVGQLEDLAGDADSVNLTEMGIDKLLGSGRISKAITVTVSEASAKATEKIEAAGGSLNMDQPGSDEFVEE
jgi:large subunit ribosomal protein L15